MVTYTSDVGFVAGSREVSFPWVDIVISIDDNGGAMVTDSSCGGRKSRGCRS